MQDNDRLASEADSMNGHALQAVNSPPYEFSQDRGMMAPDNKGWGSVLDKIKVTIIQYSNHVPCWDNTIPETISQKSRNRSRGGSI